jgi:transcriptional regulator with XRE-family HTH domain
MADKLEKLARARQMAASGEARRRRKEAGFTLREVAEATGVGIDTIWRWENGRRRPGGQAALVYLEVLERLRALSGLAA